MSWAQTSAPDALPITVAEAKANSNITDDADDNLIERLILECTAEAEAIMCRQLITATWRHRCNAFPADGVFVLWYSPMQSVTHIEYYDSAGDQQTFSSSYYTADTDSDPSRVYLNYGQSWPSDFRGGEQDIELVYVAGYGTTSEDVPEDIRHALLMMVDDRYEHRGGADVREPIPAGALTILRRNRLWLPGVM